MKKVYMSFSTDILHYGHFAIMQKAANLGELIIGVLTDEVIVQYKQAPVVSFENRCKMFQSLSFVSKVISKNTLSYLDIIKKEHPDIVVHGDDWKIGPKSKIRKELIELLKQYGGELVEFPYNLELSVKVLEDTINSRISMPEIRRGRLKKLLMLKPYVRVMEAHDGLTGLIVENARYESDGEIKTYDAIWESSLCDSASRGKPDIELIDWSERISRIHEIMEVSSKPIIVDGDTGGQEEHFVYIVQTLERIGVSAVVIEDKIGSKRNSLFGVEVKQRQDDPRHFANKICAAKKALRTQDFMIIARIESLILEQGEEDALARANCYIEAGADGVMIHSKSESPLEVYNFCEKFKKMHQDVPVVVVPTTYNSVKEEELAARGANIIIYANHLIRSAFPSMERAANEILKYGCSKCVDNICMPIREIINFIPVRGENIDNKEKIVYVPMAADIVHPGHINIIQTAAKLGNVIVGLFTDEAIISYKKAPAMTFEQRKTVIENIKGISKVVPQLTKDYEFNLRKYKPDYMVHGTDWRDGPLAEVREKAIRIMAEWGGSIIEPEYTNGISSSIIKSKTLEK